MAALHKKRFPVPSLFSLPLFGLLSLASLPVMGAELTVQIGAFGDRPNTLFAEQAAEYGELLVLRGDDGITRVSIGRYDNKDAAREALQRLQIAGYTDAYIANVRGRGTEQAAPTADLPRTPQSASRPINNPATASAVESRPAPQGNASTPTDRRLATTPEGRPIIAPKQSSTATESTITQAGRFRLRTHDTQSGQTSDVRLAGTDQQKDSGTGAASSRNIEPIVAGLGVNEIPPHLRDKLVYLDGVPHIKDGDRFIPLTDAIDGK